MSLEPRCLPLQMTLLIPARREAFRNKEIRTNGELRVSTACWMPYGLDGPEGWETFIFSGVPYQKTKQILHRSRKEALTAHKHIVENMKKVIRENHKKHEKIAIRVKSGDYTCWAVICGRPTALD